MIRVEGETKQRLEEMGRLWSDIKSGKPIKKCPTHLYELRNQVIADVKPTLQLILDAGVLGEHADGGTICFDNFCECEDNIHLEGTFYAWEDE